MKHLKTYETWIKKAWDKLVEPTPDIVLDAGFNQIEKQQLEKLGFIISVNKGKSVAKCELKSIDTIIIIQAFFLEDYYAPGVANKTYKLNINSVNKEYKNFDDVLKILKDTIPEDEIEANKYNL